MENYAGGTCIPPGWLIPPTTSSRSKIADDEVVPSTVLFFSAMFLFQRGCLALWRCILSGFLFSPTWKPHFDNLHTIQSMIRGSIDSPDRHVSVFSIADQTADG